MGRGKRWGEGGGGEEKDEVGRRKRWGGGKRWGGE